MNKSHFINGRDIMTGRGKGPAIEEKKYEGHQTRGGGVRPLKNICIFCFCGFPYLSLKHGRSGGTAAVFKPEGHRSYNAMLQITNL